MTQDPYVPQPDGGMPAPSDQLIQGYEPSSQPSAASAYASTLPSAASYPPASHSSASTYPAQQPPTAYAAQSSMSYPTPTVTSVPSETAVRLNTKGNKDDIGAVFNFSFTRFATPSLVKVLYLLWVILMIGGWLIGALLWFGAGAMADQVHHYYDDGSAGMFMVMGGLQLFLGWIPALFEIILMRVICEFFVVQFRSHSQLREINQKLQSAPMTSFNR